MNVQFLFEDEAGGFLFGEQVVDGIGEDVAATAPGAAFGLVGVEMDLGAAALDDGVDRAGRIALLVGAEEAQLVHVSWNSCRWPRFSARRFTKNGKLPAQVGSV